MPERVSLAITNNRDLDYGDEGCFVMSATAGDMTSRAWVTIGEHGKKLVSTYSNIGYAVTAARVYSELRDEFYNDANVKYATEADMTAIFRNLIGPGKVKVSDVLEVVVDLNDKNSTPEMIEARYNGSIIGEKKLSGSKVAFLIIKGY